MILSSKDGATSKRPHMSLRMSEGNSVKAATFGSTGEGRCVIAMLEFSLIGGVAIWVTTPDMITSPPSCETERSEMLDSAPLM